MALNKEGDGLAGDQPSLGVSIELVYLDRGQEFGFEYPVPHVVQINGVKVSWALLEAMVGGMKDSWFRCDRVGDEVTVHEVRSPSRLKKYIGHIKKDGYYDEWPELRNFVSIVEEMF